MNPASLLLCLSLAAPPADQPPPPPMVAGALLLEEGDPTSAAGVFERTWNTRRDPAALVWAGLSRERAADAAHAVAYLGQALTLDLPPRLADAARRGLADARRRTRLVVVELRLHGAGPVVLALTRTGRPAPTLTFELSPHPGAQVLPVALDQDTWLVELRRGPATIARTVEVDAALRTVTLAEAPAPTPPSPRTRVLRLAGLVTSANLSLLGAGFLRFGAFHVHRGLDALEADRCRPAECRRILAASAQWRAAGAGLLGAGLGLAAGALGTYFTTPRVRRIAWFVDLGVGGALVGASFVGGLAGAAFNRANQDEQLGAAITGPITRHSAGAAMLGLGLGLVSSASLGLVLDRSDARRAAQLRAHATPTGLALSGRF